MAQLATPLIRRVVSLYLGPHHELDTFTWVNAPAEARRQVAHSDVEHTGSMAVFFPLHRISKGFAPIAFYPETHVGGAQYSEDEWILAKPGDEVYGTCNAGDVVIYDSSVVHFGTANSTGNERHAVNLNYRIDRSTGLGFEELNQWEGYSTEEIRTHFDNMVAVREAYTNMLLTSGE